MHEYEVWDKQRRMTFTGEMLAVSSSRRGRGARWVEFTLYRTAAGQYITSMVGYSILYHDPNCRVVGRNKLTPVPPDVVPADFEPCPQCNPHRDAPALCPELPRSTAHLNNNADGVVRGLWRVDPGGTAYMTDVARELLASAAQRDQAVADAYLHERVA